MNSGQVCIAAKRIFLQENIAKEFMELYRAEAQKICVGDPLKAETQMGPLAGADYKSNLQSQIALAQNAGAAYFILRDNSEHGKTFADIGCLQNLPKTAEWQAQELFGPVVQIFTVSKIQEALEKMNEGPYALGGGIYSRDIEWAARLAEREVKAGFVAVNDFVKTDPRVPFGGLHDSGWGKELGLAGSQEFLNLKTIAIAE